MGSRDGGFAIEHARKCWTELMDFPAALCEAAGIVAGRKPLHPFVPYLASDAIHAAQPRYATTAPRQQSMNCLRSATGPGSLNLISGLFRTGRIDV